MEYPIVKIKTADGVWNHALFIEAGDPKAVFVNIHGTAGNFYEEDFIRNMTSRFVEEGISMLSTNNRGVGVYDAWSGQGAAVEIFENCLLDIDSWLEFAFQRGYSRIILSGHSLGTEKVVYYMAKGKYKDKIAGVILLAPASSPGCRLFGKDHKPSSFEKQKVEDLLKEAESLINNGHGDDFLSRTAYAGIMPKSAKSFVNTLGPETEILKALPFHLGKLELYRAISVPILVAIGDQHEYTAIPISDALKLMERENLKTEAHQLKNCDHDFTDHEEELTGLVLGFMKRAI